MTDYEESLACFCSFMGFIVGLIVGIYAEIFRKTVLENQNSSHKQEITVKDVIKKDSIVWVIDGSRKINCCKVISLLPKEKTAFVFNYDAWSDWAVDYDNIVRVDVDYYSDEYRDWCNRVLE